MLVIGLKRQNTGKDEEEEEVVQGEEIATGLHTRQLCV
jgi:hypothetical protein